MANSYYYDKGELLSRGMFFNLVVGNRGGGKTFNFKEWGIDDARKTGRQFVWLRRYGTEIEQMKKNFFDDVRKDYPKIKFEVKGSKKTGVFIADGIVIGHYFALTTSAIAKSSSYPLVDKIIFDEFLIIGNTYRYLNDEVVLLLEFIETIFRDRENQPDAVKPRGVYLLGNNVTVANPYFLYFGIKPFKQKFYVDKERGICVQQYSNEAFIEAKKKSKIGKLTAGTTYADYSIENKAYLDNDKFIAKKVPNAAFNCAIDYKGRTYGFWLDHEQGNIYVNYQFDPDSYRHYSLTKDDHSINTFLIKSASTNIYLRNVVWLFRAGCMFFENQQIKSQVYEMLSYFVR